VKCHNLGGSGKKSLTKNYPDDIRGKARIFSGRTWRGNVMEG